MGSGARGESAIVGAFVSLTINPLIFKSRMLIMAQVYLFQYI